ncbi:MAG: alpha-amylase family glycosyl hydrolase [Anaerolineae bacterium]|nr:alpha-amylase family glycosyl hydrolase [Anaerolineae bacterium]
MLLAGYYREFHVSRAARDRYGFDDSLFSVRGTLVLPNFRAARLVAQKMNQKRDLVNFPEQAVKASHINAMALIHELMHLMIVAYREAQNPQLWQEALDRLTVELSEPPVENTMGRYADDFPVVAVYRGQMTPREYLQGYTGPDSNREVVLEEALLLWLMNNNPAASPYVELFDDINLERETAYRQVIEELREFLGSQPSFGPGGQSLFDVLEAPIKAAPYSLTAQLEYIRRHWAPYLGRHLYRLLAGLDFIAEEEKPVFFGPGPTLTPDFAHLEAEPERFSPDLDWMPKVVMIAKNTYVWLDQLSKKYGRHIYRLDQIPDEELDQLARWGFTGLWLIGLWERSRASQRIKQLMGNPEAVASAYSLYDYQIAADLGGYEAYQNLRERAWRRGIRLASDMVPNHVGIDGKWVYEHPDWFIYVRQSPYPWYTFDGPELSSDDRYSIKIEDRYYNRTDAAVVFMRRDKWTGDVRFIYHGNDGTSMPWNDTAQLNYLNPEVREAVIQTILHVARMFPIIRFDAAMTLAKRHYQRLWFPEPGSGGDIPTRAEFAMTKAEFDAAMPNEFWREVVDRVQAEVPDTLLLAEAFWLMEGYFVRTLGMHRVYNSAFMNMLKMEENAKYRSVIKNTVEFDPEILKRYVNFMNNPDEDTAVAQFGKDDKYFGVCTMLATMPGLPMFGHGQVEGFTEKYGMEYRRAYYDEKPDEWLVRRHEREIFPLLHKRYLFAEVANFRLYDFFSPDGTVNENVFAYSNRSGDERALVVYHNKWAEARGWIRTSAAYAVKEPDGSKRLEQCTLAEGLGLPNDPSAYVIFRDVASNLEYLRSCAQLHAEGMYIELGAFKYHVFLDFRIVHENEWGQYGQLMGYLQGRGVPSVEEAMKEVFLQPIHTAFKALVNAGMLQRLADAALRQPDDTVDEGLLDEVEEMVRQLAQAVQGYVGAQAEGLTADALAVELRQELATLWQLPTLADRLELAADGGAAVALRAALRDEPATWGVAFGWLFTHGLGKVVSADDYVAISRAWLDEWLLSRLTAAALREWGLSEPAAARAVAAVKVLVEHQRWTDLLAEATQPAHALLKALLADPAVQQFLQVNRYQGVLWFNKESFEELAGWLAALAAVQSLATQPEEALASDLAQPLATVAALLEAEQASGYRVDRLLAAAQAAPAAAPSLRP